MKRFDSFELNPSSKKISSQEINDSHDLADQFFRELNNLSLDHEDFLTVVNDILKYTEISVQNEPNKKAEHATFKLLTLYRKLKVYLEEFKQASNNQKIIANLLFLKIVAKNPNEFEVTEHKTILAHICHAISSLFIEKKCEIESIQDKLEFTKQACFYGETAWQLNPDPEFDPIHLQNYVLALESHAHLLRDMNPKESLFLYQQCIAFYNKYEFLNNIFVLSCCYAGYGDLCVKFAKDSKVKDDDKENFLINAINFYKIVIFTNHNDNHSQQVLKKINECIHMLVVALLELGKHYEKKYRKSLFDDDVNRIRNIYIEAYSFVQNDSVRKQGIVASRLGYFHEFHKKYKMACMYFSEAVQKIQTDLKARKLMLKNPGGFEYRIKSINSQIEDKNWKSAALQYRSLVKELVSFASDDKFAMKNGYSFHSVKRKREEEDVQDDIRPTSVRRLC